MISELKTRTLSLFRRSSAGSTQSVGSSGAARSSNDQLPSSAQQSTAAQPASPTKKRPASTRSRSSLVIPRVKSHDSSRHPVSVSGSAQAGPAPLSQGRQTQSRAGPREPGEPQFPPHHTGLVETTVPASHATLHSNSHEQLPQAKQHNPPAANTSNPQSISSPRPLPTPDPSPFQQPDTNKELNVISVIVQSPPADDRTPRSPDAEKLQTSNSSNEQLESISEGQEDQRPRRSLQLDLAGRSRAVSAGKRSLLDSRPRSPLHQCQIPGRTGSASGSTGSGPPPGHTGNHCSRPSQDLEPGDYFSSIPGTPRYSRTPPAMASSPQRYPQQFSQMQPPRKRKIWVKRPNASATMVTINEDDMVDDARDMILRKYANSLGKSFDSPDVTLRIRPREQPTSASQRSGSAQHTPSPLLDERSLRPDEVLSRTIDVYFPGGQSVEEALVIDTPTTLTHQKSRRTPRHSPGVHATHYGVYGNQYEDSRPSESDKDYFPPMVLAPQPAINGQSSPRIVGALPLVGSTGHPHSIAVLNGGQLPSLPSPRDLNRDGLNVIPVEGAKRRHGDHRRPKFGRTHTTSPTVVQHPDNRQTAASNTTNSNQVSTLTTPPHPPPVNIPAARAATPPPARVASPRPKAKRGKKPSMSGSVNGITSPHVTGLLASVPPINVLVVEDNIINLKLLEAFLKRLKVRSVPAKDGREAVAKWREGGFHLVLMDIQLPLMNGLEATKEIRRLERVNGIGAFVKSANDEKLSSGSKTPDPDNKQVEEADTATAKEDAKKEGESNRIGKKELFKSPVIIVALTASSLHSDRSEALAAGCNDFLTKPVNLTWLERKLKEWGCMQALIDFDGWRQWKDFQSPVAIQGPSPKMPQTTLKKTSFPAPNVTSSATVNVEDKRASHSNPANPVSITGGAGPGPVTSLLQELNANAESTESTTTLDSMTSDDADSLDTAMPPRKDRTHGSPGTSPTSLSPPRAPILSVQEPTPRQSTDLLARPSPETLKSPGSLLTNGTTEKSGVHSPGMSVGPLGKAGSINGKLVKSDERKALPRAQHARVLSAVGEESESTPSSPKRQDEVHVGA